MTTYIGSCHYRGIIFEVEGEIDSGLACNCSIEINDPRLRASASRHQVSVNSSQSQETRDA
jgi:hypothetical protein